MVGKKNEVKKNDVNDYIAATDLPATEDDFGIDNYIKSMAEFLMECATPLTVSIQGSWGTGKTSIMGMISKKLDPQKCKYVEFNTWQFSQFELDDTLSQTLIKSLISKIDPDKANSKNMGALFTGLSVVKYIGMPIAEKLTGIGAAAELFKTAMEAVTNQLGNNSVDASSILKKIKSEFKESVDKCPKERIIIFIDDLDRLEPRKAVELLEVLKNFLDCSKCVFVLAIDYDVVCRGVADKYNFDYDDPANVKKGKDFFDKIIQVPFKMPIEQYNITTYLEKQLTTIRVNNRTIINAGEIKQYSELVESSIGTNPRAIKRLKNSYQLLCMIADKNQELDILRDKLLIFATLCLQELDYSVYKSIIKQRDNLTPEMLICLSANDSNGISEYYPEIDEKTTDMGRVSKFMKILVGILDVDKDNPLTADELKSFKTVLTIASITGNESNESEQKVSKLLYRYDGMAYEKQGSKLKFYNLAHDLIENEVIETSWTREDFLTFVKEVSEENRWKFLIKMVVFNPSDKKDRLMENPFVFADGEKAYLWRWWGESDIDKLINVIEKHFDKQIDYEKIKQL